MEPETGSRTRMPSARSVAVSLALAALAAAASWGGSAFVSARFPDRPTPRDTLFELLPYSADARYVVGLALLAGIALFLAHACFEVPDRLPAFVCVVSVMYVLRGALIGLTPLANAHGEGVFFFPVVQHGMFPSGHSALALLLVLLTDPARAPRLRRVLWALAVIVWVTLLIAHGHYSIDVAGGVLLAYFCEREWSGGKLFRPLKRALGSLAG